MTRYLKRRRKSLPNVLLGAELATQTGLGVGDRAEIIAASSVLPIKCCRQDAAFAWPELFAPDSSNTTPPGSTFRWTQPLLSPASTHAASVISVQVRDIYDVKQAARRIRESLGPSYTTIDWQEANRPLFTALTLERRIGLIIIALIILIAALNITTTLILVVTERRQDIAILNAMGATRKSIMGIFMIEGAITGVLGALLGLLLGIVDRLNRESLQTDQFAGGCVFNRQCSAQSEFARHGSGGDGGDCPEHYRHFISRTSGSKDSSG